MSWAATVDWSRPRSEVQAVAAAARMRKERRCMGETPWGDCRRGLVDGGAGSFWHAAELEKGVLEGRSGAGPFWADVYRNALM